MEDSAQHIATFSESLSIALPEIILAVGAMVLLILGVFRGDRSAGLIGSLSIALFIIAGFAIIQLPSERLMAFGGTFIVDSYARFLKILVLIGSSVAILMSVAFNEREKMNRFEFPILIVLAVLGMCMMLSANSLIALYMGLELQSLSLYVLAAMNRDSLRSTEAGLKYFVLGALSSGLLLYGSSLIYGFTGTTQFDVLGELLHEGDLSIGLIFGLVFLSAGLAFKISAVPFHMWTPDVYEGAPTPVTAFFAAAPKVAAMGLFVRVLITGFTGEDVTPQWQQIIITIALLSMVVGAFGAIGQTNIKRLMAYSSIGHMGYALVGLAAGSQEGVRGILIYLLIYFAMTLGMFACILSMKRRDGMVENIDELSGLSRNQPMMAFGLMVLLFSLAGIPPFAGFFAKFYVFMAAVKAELYLLAVLGVVTSVIGAFYYLRIVKIMYFDDPTESFDLPMRGEMQAVLTASGLFTGLYAVFSLPLIQLAGTAASSLFP